ncbi:MAG: HAD family hydrolase [Gemmatimonadales bacterium]
MTIRLVVFDLSGTTVHDGGGVVRRTLRDVLAGVGLELREGALEGVAGLPKRTAIRTLLEGHGRDELLDRLDSLHADFASRMRRWYRDDPAVREVTGATETFRALHAAGIQVAIATGFTRDVLDVVLARLGWVGADSPVNATRASDEVKRSRPWPDAIESLRKSAGDLPAAAVAKVGDTAADLQEGTMARCGLVVGVLTGGHAREVLEAQPHDQIIGSLAELPSLLERLQLLPAQATT